MGNSTVSVHPPPPSDDDVREQLERILLSAEFIIPDRGRSFLRFIVGETLAGRSQYLKAFTLAQSVFDRNDSFDAPNDPCVRAMAGRLRSALERYYLTAGITDNVVITVPKGHYIPIFSARVVETCAEAANRATDVEATSPEPSKRESRLIRWIMVGASMIVLAAVVLASLAERNNAETKSPLASGGRPVIKIEHFKDTGQGNISDNVLRRLTDEIVVDLSKFTELVLIAPDDAPQKVDPTYVLQGSVRLQDGHMRPVARLVRKADGVVVWSADYDVSTEGRSTLDVVAAIGRSIARAIAAPLSEPVVGATGGAASTLRPASYFQPAEGVSTETSRPISAMGDQAQQLRIPQRQGGSASSPLWAMTTV